MLGAVAPALGRLFALGEGGDELIAALDDRIMFP
jgi:hypothetical protein